MSASLAVRPARVEDVAQKARVNVRSWKEPNRGLMTDVVLADWENYRQWVPVWSTV